MSRTLITGGCLCGAIRYAAAGPPYDVTHCHCEDCRRSSGAPFVTWASFARETFRFTKGEPKLFHWADRDRGHCAECGTALIFSSQASPDEIDVTVCSFDDPSEARPADHTWIEDRVPWMREQNSLPEFPRGRTK